jgi:predicted Zn-dependent peptidase
VARPDEAFRARPPDPSPAEPFTPPAVHVEKLRNGITVLLVHEASPFETLEVVGTIPGDPAPAEVRQLLAGTVLDGTAKYDRSALDEKYARILMPRPLGTFYLDSVQFSQTFPAEKLDDAVDVLAEIVLRPAFDRHAFERSQRQQAVALEPVVEDANFATRTAIRTLLGPYGAFPTAKGIDAVRREDVVALYGRAFRPSRMALVAVGGAEEAKVLAALDRGFGGAPAPVERPVPAPAHTPAPAAPRLVVVDKPASDVSFIAEGFALSSIGSDDEVAATMASWVEMDNHGGRGAARLRDELKLVPWVKTFAFAGRLGGVCGWSTQAPTAKVAAVLAEADAVTREMAATGPTPDEVQTVRAVYGEDIVRSFKTTDSAAGVYALRFSVGLPADGLAAESARIDAMTAESLRAAAAKYLDPARTRVVIVGDLAALREPLRALGWGPIEVRDAAGAVVRTERAK